MPILMFTANEVAGTLIERQRELSDQILDLSDTDKTPLGPGESVAERHHKIAKLGKRLAEAVRTLSQFVGSAPESSSAEPAEPSDNEIPKGAN